MAPDAPTSRGMITAHPWWTAYITTTVMLNALWVVHLSRNKARAPDDRVPAGWYIAWAAFNFVWPIIIGFVLIMIAAD